MTDKQTLALRDYRQLMRLMARDSTLSDAQLAQLALAQEVLGLTEFDTEEDLEAINRHADLCEALEGARTRYGECKGAIEETENIIARAVTELEDAQRRNQEAQECIEAAEAELSELLNLEKDNPRIFPPDSDTDE